MLTFVVDLLALGCINAILATGLNLQYGFAGLLNFAYYSFVAIGEIDQARGNRGRWHRQRLYRRIGQIH